MKKYYVYMLSNHTNTTLYIGVTGNLPRRMNEHIGGLQEGFTKKYHTNKLVYIEEYSEINTALEREKQLKHWRREKKNELVNALNPEWKDLLLDM